MKLLSPEDQYNKDCLNAKKWAEAYYTGTPMVPDPVYDATIRRIAAYEAKYKVSSGILETVGCDIQGTPLAKVTLSHRMYSMANAFTPQDVEAFLSKTPADAYIVEYKYDGLAGELTYKHGALVQAATRGDGTIGEDVLHNAKYVTGVPHSITKRETVVVHGEFVVLKTVFDRSEGQYSSPRNMAAGIMRTLDTSKIQKYPICFVPYKVIGLGCKTQAESLNALRDIGFDTMQRMIVNAPKSEMPILEEYYRECVSRRKQLPWDADGLVIKVNDLEQSEKYGYTAKAPKAAIAWKFPTPCVETTISEVIAQVGRTGIITPKALFSPSVLIDGVVVTKATLHNYGECSRKGYGVGAKVEVTRNGGVVPGVAKVITPVRKPVSPPTECPACGSHLIDTTVDLSECRCLNTECIGKRIESAIHLLSRDCLNVMGAGRAMIVFMVEALGFRGFQDMNPLFWDTEKRQQLIKQFGVNAKKVLNGFDSLFLDGAPWDKMLFGLGIDHVGAEAAQDIAKYFDADALLKLSGKNKMELRHKASLGVVTAEAVYQFVSAHRLSLASFFKAIPPQKKKPQSDRLAGLIFCITGSLSRPKAYFEDLVASRGGVMGSSVTAKTSYLVLGDSGHGSTKHLKAMGAGITVIDENTFLEIIGGHDAG